MNVWVSLVLENRLRLHCTWLVPSHIEEYHFKALTTTSFSRRDQTPRTRHVSISNVLNVQHHVAHSSKRPSRGRPGNSHLPLPTVSSG